MNTSNLRKACLFISILAPTYPAQIIADMFSWFKEYDVHLSPVVKGKITFNGNPVANVKVFRELDYDTSYNDDTASNEMGQFQFAEKNIKSRKYLLYFYIFVFFLSLIFYLRLTRLELFHPYKSIFYNIDYARNLD